uniref:Glycosyltransferase family 2 protein n=1 Tax=Erysipelothrix tonsillarum TaxID=38402 RepID=A0A6S6I6G0_9FIRM|nr:glycosyltransferase family 2 protein [Erysipelothrix tonsillarum]
MFSVVVPMYNSELTIEKCICSICNQTRVDLIKEILVINDGSTDESVEKVKKLQSVFSNIKIINKPNGGVSTARNVGMRLAKEDWVAFIDSDDEWMINKIELQSEILKNYSEILFLGANRNDEFIKIGEEVYEGVYKINFTQLLFKTWPHTSTVVISKEVIDRVGYFDENRSHCEDSQYWYKVAKFTDIYYLYESLELAGGGKLSFGTSGLSSNLRKMHQGNISNYKELYLEGTINWIRFILVYIYEKIKYLRRIIITKKR